LETEKVNSVAKKIYFASDFHLGLKTGTPVIEREKRVVNWLLSVAPDAEEIYLLGDIFDFWWEYRHVVPRGYTRFLGTVSSITDSGVPVHFFGGNHDMWVGNYLSQECGMIIHSEPLIRTFGGKKFYLAHGEGLGTESLGYKILLAIFRNKPLRFMYSMLHPWFGMGFGYQWSLHSRLGKGISQGFLGEEKEDLFRHSRKILETKQIDYFIYGHRHLPLQSKLEKGALLTIMGDWILKGSYAVWDGSALELKFLP
jgi:UDP-2,3-diacylglucosamine hydrolase